jgi:hypothetical protein
MTGIAKLALYPYCLMPRPDHARPGVQNLVLLMLQLIIQTACAGTVCSGYWTMCQIPTCVILRTIVRSTWWPVPGR